MTTYYRAWGQDPQRPGRVFTDPQAAKRWAESEAPMSCGYGFVERVATKRKPAIVALFSERTRAWSPEIAEIIGRLNEALGDRENARCLTT